MNQRVLTGLGLGFGAAVLVLFQFGGVPLSAGTTSPQDTAKQEEAAEQEERAQQEAIRLEVEALEDAEALLRRRVEAMPRVVEIQGLGGGGFSSISVSEVNGVKTINVNESDKEYVIKESSDEVEVAFVKAYGPNDLEQLKEDYPDLHMHVVSFPNSTQDGEVSLTVNVKVVRKAADAEALKAEHPDAYEIYEKYANQQNGIRLRGGFGDIPRVMLPRLDAVPVERIRALEIDEMPFEAIPEIRIRKDGDDSDEEEAEKPEGIRPRRIIKT